MRKMIFFFFFKERISNYFSRATIRCGRALPDSGDISRDTARIYTHTYTHTHGAFFKVLTSPALSIYILSLNPPNTSLTLHFALVSLIAAQG